MADVRETTTEQYPQASPEDEDMRGADGKKKKFKPLSAVRKLFGGKKRKKEESVVTVKAQSTTALHSVRYGDEDDEDDDDGGFISHQQKSVGLVHGTRSLSEDSVFSPEQREAPIGSFPKSAVSEESLPKSAFQSELFSKLSKRRSQYSDDDRDDGLPRSPVPPVTTADVIMGAPLKPPGKKSSNRDSDQSLISVDSSENEEDKLFETNWKNSVPSIKSSKQEKHGSNSGMDSLDFSSIQKTELLTSGAAKDRISIKPKARRATSKARKKRDTNSPLSLPSLNEESATGAADTNNAVSPSGSKYTKTIGDTAAVATSATKSPVKVTSAPVFAPPGPSSSATNSESSPKSAFNIANPSNVSGTVKETKSVDSNRKTVLLSADEVKASTMVSELPSGKVSPTSKNVETTNVTDSGSNTSRLASRFLQGGKSEDTKDAVTSPTSPEKSTSSTAAEAFGGVSLKSRMSQFQGDLNKTHEEKPPVGRGSGLKTSDPNAQFSPKGEDFRLKRQNRSKTLPGAADSHDGGESSANNSPGLQRAKSHRVPGTVGGQVDTVLTGSASIKSSSGVDFQDRRPSQTSTTAAATSSIAPTSTVNKLGSRFAAFENNNSSSSEPAWMNMVKKKKDESETNSTTSSAGGNSKSGPVSSAPKSVFSSSSYLESKRGSVDSSSSGGNNSSRTNTPRDTSKVSEASSSTSSSAYQGKRESIEINVSELSSLKSSSNKTTVPGSAPSSSVFTSTSSSATSQTVATASTADRARLFSGTAQTSSTPSTKQDSASDTENSSVAGAGSGISRGGSVKTSPTKSAASSDSLKPWQSGRSSSVKVSPAFLAASNPSSTTANISKPSGIELTNKTVSVSSSISSKSPTTSSSPSVPSTASSSTTSPSSSGRFAQPTSNNNKNNTSNNNTSLPSSHSVMVTTTSTSASTIPTSASSPTRSSSVKSALTSKPPLAASAFGVKSSGVKSVSFSGVNSDNSSSSSSNTTTTSTSSSTPSPRSNSGASIISVNSSSSSSSSSSSTTSLSASQSNLSKTPFGGAGRTNPIRAHASFTHPSSVKPVISPSSTPSINKSPSMRATHLPSSSSSSSSNTNKFTTPALKRANIDEQNKEEEKSTATVPAWRANLAAKKDKEVKIEIIESASKSQSSAAATSCSQQNKTEVVMRKQNEKSAFSEAAKKPEAASNQAASDKLNNRSSRVLDMVKNFQNLQVTT